ncbi:MAG: flagellar hook-length control protein FliK [Piscinibacter sp.]|uniref:flagellar hook-length control protein FliK n=1 Tax=Piscinibacter sp. TaxID=1903157 RepID=UPI00258330F5|nr:flagellar hook-length control protein FliK [Piscinibacter sp.]MCW5666097.1 flagellar hook-length control protein FliK [Piscinibacter sp.]
MALQIAPTLPSNAPPQSAAPGPAETGEDSGFARLLHGQTSGPGAGDDDADAATVEATPAATAAAPDEPADPAAVLDPSLAHWLAGLHLPAPPDAPSPGRAATPGGAGSEESGESLAGVVAGSPRPAGPRGLAERGLAERGLPERGTADPRAAAAREPAAATGLPRAAAEPHEAVAAAAHDPAPRNAPIELPAALNVGAPPPVSATSALTAPAAAAPVDVALPLGPADAGFGEAVATQVSLLARDGVQQAELHLNPAETGPVSVQIVLEGTQARIDFGADALPTRQAIEGSLPELAAALREEGLTLSGGGVSEHARGRHEPPAEPGAGGTPRRGAAPADATAPVRSVQIARAGGGLDLYA